MAVIDAINEHLAVEHDVIVERTAKGDFLYEMDGYRWEMGQRPDGLLVSIEAPDNNAMMLFKEEIIAHIQNLDATAAASIRWSGEMTPAGILPPNFTPARVIRSEELFLGMQRVTLEYERPELFDAASLHVRVLLPRDDEPRPVWPKLDGRGVPLWPEGKDELHVRWMTIRTLRQAPCQIDIDVAWHDHGRMSEWAKKARAGTTVGLMGPAGTAVLPVTTGLFLAADGTGIPTIARQLECLPEDAKGDVVAALPESSLAAAYFGQTPLTVHDLKPLRFDRDILWMAKDFANPSRTQYAFFAGEVHTAKQLRHVFRSDLSLGKGKQVSTGFWRQETAPSNTC
ncbi:MAG: siderophore-interacting protein [Pseudomonadota bacterium]